MRVSTASIILFGAMASGEKAFADSQQVWLVDCLSATGTRTSELAIYPGWPQGYPASTIQVPTEGATVLAWSYANITKILPGGHIFSVTGFGMNREMGTGATYDSKDITCIPYEVDNLYTKLNGTACTSAFQCTHLSAIADRSGSWKQASRSAVGHDSRFLRSENVPANSKWGPDKTAIQFYAFDEKVVVSGRLSAWDIFGEIWNNRDAVHFFDKPVGFGNSQCTVRFTGSGVIEWTTVDGLGNTLGAVAGAPGFLQYNSWKELRCTEFCDDPVHPNRCCQRETVTLWQTHIPSRMKFEAVNVPPPGSERNPSRQGELEYRIQCPETQNIGCILCEVLGAIASAGSEVGKRIGAAFSVADMLISSSCHFAGCT
jgi:hypothetical protein